MNNERIEAQVKTIQQPDRATNFPDGSVRVVVVLLEKVAIGYGTYLPGWKWSVHVGPMTGRTSQQHVGYVLSGRMAVRGCDGREIEAGPNEAFAAEPGHDAWVVGDEPCIALDWWPLKD